MSLDATPVGQLAAELMGRIAEAYPDHENATVGTVAVIVEVKGADENGDFTALDWRCNDPRAWVQAGLFDHVAAAARTPPRTN